MAETRCFVVMPFRPELNYFYLFIKRYLEEKYRVRVERGDSNVLTKELLKKISDCIHDASFLIADVSGYNANVFFELGIAYEKKKSVIYLTQNDPREAPIDIRQFEYIEYQLDRHEDFVAKLDNAVRNVLGASLDIPNLYERARGLLKEFNTGSGFSHAQASFEEFHARAVRSAETLGVPDREDVVGWEGFLLPKIMQDVTDQRVMRRVTTWLEKRGSLNH